MSEKNFYILLSVLGGVILVGCVFLAWFGLLVFNRPNLPGLDDQTPAVTVTATIPAIFQPGSPKPGATDTAQPAPTSAGQTDTVQPAPTTESPTDTTAPSPAPVFQPAPGSLPGKLAFPYRFNRINSLYVIDLGDNSKPVSTQEPLNNQLLTAPVISPDGKQVAFNYLKGGMYVYEIGSSEPARYLAPCGAPSWSPDSTQVICKSDEEDSFIIVDVKDGSVVRSIPVVPSALFPTWSPTGDEVIFNTVDGQGNSGIWRMSLSGDSSPAILAGQSGGENYAPSWSPDGQWIAFQSNMNSELSDIYVMDREGGNLRRVVTTPSEFWSRAPAWSPDGQWMAYVSNQAGSIGDDYGEVFIVSMANKAMSQVTQTGGRVYDWRVSWGK